MHRVARQIYHSINQANNIVLVPHPNPDGDALGSVTAFVQYLRSINKPHITYCATPSTPKLSFLPHSQNITNDFNEVKKTNPDLIIIFDSGDLRYAGIDEHVKSLVPAPTIINIDHHNTNEHYGTYNMVIPTASSTTEILYHFFRFNNISLNKEIANCLLTGLMTDTDNFSNGATSAKSLAIASKLIHLGADTNLIKHWIFKDLSLNALKLWGMVLSRLDHDKKTDIVHTYLLQTDLNKYNVSDDETEGIANFMNSLSDGKATLVLKEIEGNMVKGSFRTTRNDVDVSVWAKSLDGGGHKKAAGFTVSGPIKSALSKVLSTIMTK
jgi:bifunctional oligoribonuclease and PAP phosphatase NrnA